MKMMEEKKNMELADEMLDDVAGGRAWAASTTVYQKKVGDGDPTATSATYDGKGRNTSDLVNRATLQGGVFTAGEGTVV